MSPFPFLPFLFFFFLQQHFLIMQKQHVRISNAATTAIAMMAQDGTEENTQTRTKMAHPLSGKNKNEANTLMLEQTII